jgi:hypothetical protein
MARRDRSSAGGEIGLAADDGAFVKAHACFATEVTKVR